LQPFLAFDRNVNACFPSNARLNKAIRMADLSFGKVKAIDASQNGEALFDGMVKEVFEAKK
jgi:hypothetical protein